MASVEFVPDEAKTDGVTAHVIWMTTGLSCDGDSVAMTSATSPSLEDIITQAIPGMPKVVVHNPVLAYEVGDEFMQAWYDAEAGKLDFKPAPLDLAGFCERLANQVSSATAGRCPMRRSPNSSGWT